MERLSLSELGDYNEIVRLGDDGDTIDVEVFNVAGTAAVDTGAGGDVIIINNCEFGVRLNLTTRGGYDLLKIALEGAVVFRGPVNATMGDGDDVTEVDPLGILFEETVFLNGQRGRDALVGVHEDGIPVLGLELKGFEIFEVSHRDND